MTQHPGSSASEKQSVVAWARRVSSDETHDLCELEDRLRAQAEPDSGVRPMTILGIVAMVAGITVTWGASDGVGGAGSMLHDFDFDAGFELAVLFVTFLLVCAFQASVMRYWATNGGVRDSGTLIASAAVTVTGTGALILTLTRVDLSDPLRVTLHALPPVLAMLAGLAGVIIEPNSRRPAYWRSGMHGPPTPNLAALSQAKQAPLREERNTAIQILADRGLLSADAPAVDDLMARPLGRLLG